jgi:D-psicose/D-tagatose/L-ribulose 3-epimerase
VGILFDTYHANIEEKNIGAALEQTGPYLQHVHTCENDRGIPGTGHVEWSTVFAALRKLDYDGWLTIEGFGFSLGALSSAASIWRDLAPTSGAIAFDGIKFLQDQIKSQH